MFSLCTFHTLETVRTLWGHEEEHNRTVGVVWTFRISLKPPLAENMSRIFTPCVHVREIGQLLDNTPMK